VNLPPPENVPPGWYQDPYQPGQLRWWDGGAWSSSTQPLPTATSPVSSPTRSKTFWDQGRTTVALLVSAFFAPATSPRPIGSAFVAAVGIPLAALAVFSVWSVLNRPRPTMKHMVLGGLVAVPSAVIWVVPNHALQGWFIAGLVFAVIVLGAVTVLTLAGMQDNQTRAVSTIYAVLGVFFLLDISAVVVFLGMYALYRNITQATAPTHQAPSGTATPSSYVAPAAVAHPVLSPGSGRTPTSKYVAIVLWALAARFAAIYILDGLAAPAGPRAGITGNLWRILGAAGLFAIPGYIAWMLYKSATSGPLSRLTIVKRAFAAASALAVAVSILTFVATDAHPDVGWVTFFFFLPLSVISLVITVLLYVADGSRSSRSRK